MFNYQVEPEARQISSILEDSSKKHDTDMGQDIDRDTLGYAVLHKIYMCIMIY